jgi:hypothetical protein
MKKIYFVLKTLGVSTNSRKRRKLNKRSNFDLKILHRFQLKNFFHANLFRFNEGVGYPPANLSHLRGENFAFSKTQLCPANLFDLCEFVETPTNQMNFSF